MSLTPLTTGDAMPTTPLRAQLGADDEVQENLQLLFLSTVDNEPCDAHGPPPETPPPAVDLECPGAPGRGEKRTVYEPNPDKNKAKRRLMFCDTVS